jgi:hypothetical protein
MKTAKTKRQKDNAERRYYSAIRQEQRYTNDFWNTVSGLYSQEKQWELFFKNSEDMSAVAAM